MTEHHAFLRDAQSGPVIDIRSYDAGHTEPVDLIHLSYAGRGTATVYEQAATELAIHGWTITTPWNARCMATIERTPQ